MSLKGKKQKFTITRGEGETSKLENYEIELDEGMVVLDCVHRIQYEQEPDLEDTDFLEDEEAEKPVSITEWKLIERK